MTVRQPRYSKEEFARRGNKIYEMQVRSLLEAGDRGKIVAIASYGLLMQYLQQLEATWFKLCYSYMYSTLYPRDLNLLPR